MSKELRDAYAFAKEAERGGLPAHESRSLDEIWTEMVSSSLKKLKLTDYSAFCAARGLPTEWLGQDGAVQHMKLEHVLHLADQIAVRSPCKDPQVRSISNPCNITILVVIRSN